MGLVKKLGPWDCCGPRIPWDVRAVIYRKNRDRNHENFLPRPLRPDHRDRTTARRGWDSLRVRVSLLLILLIFPSQISQPRLESGKLRGSGSGTSPTGTLQVTLFRPYPA